MKAEFMPGDIAAVRKYPFLPPSRHVGWLPYVWLIYLMNFVIEPAFGHASALEWVLTGLGVLAFLPLYFLGYWICGHRSAWLASGMWLLGALFAHWNPAASCFVIYAAACVHDVGEPKVAWRWIGAFFGLTALQSWVMHLSPYYWTVALCFTPLVGAVMIDLHRKRKMDCRLELAQDEIDRLARIAERERIARDLHDLLGHTLSVIVLKSELASKLAETDPPRAAQEIRDVERISREALTEVRAAVRGYHSVGLDAELEHAREALTAAGIEFDSKVEPVTVSASQESVLALAIREAVTNVVRHAGAKSCQLALRCRYFGCELEIADDGRGGSDPDGFGLSGMRERVETLGGTLERDGSEGMRLILRLPVPGANRNAASGPAVSGMPATGTQASETHR
jgi:two-component system sensor histidine kinase DesK